MSLGGRKCPTIKAIPFSSPKIRSSPTKPLLFLYPPWFSSTYNSPALPTTSTFGRTLPRPNLRPESKHGHSLFTKRTSKRVSKFRDSTLRRYNAGPSEKLEHEQSSSPSNVLPEKADRNRTLGTHAAHQELSDATELTRIDGITDLDGEKAAPESLKAQENPIYTFDNAIRTLDDVGSWAEERFRRVASTRGRTIARQDTVPFIQRAERREALRLDKSLASRILKDRGALSSDWRVPLKLLLANKWALEPKIDDNSVTIFIPEEVLSRLLGALEEGTWTMYLKSRCRIRVLPRSESTGVMRQCLLSGSPLSIDLAKDYISTVWADVEGSRPNFFAKVPFIPQASFLKPLSDDHDPLIRAVWAGNRKPLLPRRVDHIPRPLEWSVKSFADYIEDITANYMPSGMHRYYYKENKQHLNMVETIVKNLFIDPANIEYFSTRALNITLRFLYKNRLLKTARYLCIRFDEAHGTFVAETFNIMLHGAATENDLFSYTYALALMIRQEIKADAHAWISLLYTVSVQEVRLVILQHMKRAGFLTDENVVRRAIPAIVKESFCYHIDHDKDFNSYLKWMDWRHGRAWFGRVAVNKILSALADRGRLDGIPDVMKEIYEREAMVDTATLNIILVACRELGAIVFAIDSLRELSTNFKVSADEMTYWILFDMAWKARLRNVCRAVWSHACLNGLTSYRMRVMILRSLWKRPKDSPESKWGYEAGKVIAGVGDNELSRMLVSSEGEADNTGSIISKDGADLGTSSSELQIYTPLPPASSLSTHESEDQTRFSPVTNSTDYRVQVARNILSRDLRVALHWSPSLSMHQDLCRAYAQDLEWEESGAAEVQEGDRLGWMIQDGYQVPLKARRKTLMPAVQQEDMDMAKDTEGDGSESTDCRSMLES